MISMQHVAQLIILGCLLFYLTASASARQTLEDVSRALEESGLTQSAVERLISGESIEIIATPNQDTINWENPNSNNLTSIREGLESERRLLLDTAGFYRGEILGSDAAGRRELSPLLTFRYTSSFVVQVDVSAAQALLLAGAHLEEPQLHRPHLSESVSTIGADDLHDLGVSGSAAVAIIDTGVDLSHPAFTGRIVGSFCFSSSGALDGRGESFCPNGENVDVHSPSAGDACALSVENCGHGTHVAGIAAGASAQVGVAPSASIIAIQASSQYDPEDCGSPENCALFWSYDYIRALDFLIENHQELNLAVVNMSLGGGEESECPLNPIASQIALLRSLGIATVISSGNDGHSNAVASPGCVRSAITVGATNRSDNLWRPLFGLFRGSNSSELVDVLAPGVNIRSAYPGDEYASFTGTSMAAPHVAGAIALLRQAFPDASVTEMEAALESTGVAVVHPFSGLVKQRIDVQEAYNRLLERFGEHDLTVVLNGSGTITADGALLECSPSNCNGTFAHNRQVVLQPQPSEGWTFRGWAIEECAESRAAAQNCTITFNRDRTVAAEFVPAADFIGATSPIGPINGVQVGTQPSMLWRAASNANRYFVVVSEDLNVIQNIVGNNLGSCTEANCIISASFSSTAFAPYNLQQACNYPDSVPSGRMDVLEPGRTYYWAIQPLRRNSCSDYDEGPWSSIGRFVTLNEVVAPANDNLADATPISGTAQSYTFTNIGASRETDEPLHANNSGGASIWWRWTAPATAQYTIETTGTDFNPVLAVYRGTELSGLQLVAGNDDATGEDSSVMLDVAAGDQYFIAIDGFNGAEGNGTMRIGTQGPVRYPLEIAILGDGQVTGECNSGSCVVLRVEGDAVALTAAADDGNRFDGWGSDCASFGTNLNCTFPMNGPRSVTARFSRESDQTGLVSTYIYPHDAIVDGAAWRLLGESAWRTSGNTAAGVALGQSVIEFRETPGWVTPDDFVLTLTSGANSREVHMDYLRPEKSLIVEFDDDGDGRGEITVPGPVTCSNTCTIPMGNAAVTRVQAFPAAGSIFGGWTGDCVETSEVVGAYWCDVDFRTRAGDHTVGVKFDADPDAERFSFTVELRSMDGLGQARIMSSTHSEIDCVDRCTYEFADGETVTLDLQFSDSVLVRYFGQDSRFAGWQIRDSFSINWPLNSDQTAIFDLAASSSRYVQRGASTDGLGRVLTFPSLRYHGTEIDRSCEPDDYRCRDIILNGENFDVLANPEPGWALFGWSGLLAERCTRDQNPCSITIDGAEPEYLFDAIFTPIISVAAIGSGSGRIVGGPSDASCTTDECRSRIIDCGEVCAAIAERYGPHIAFYAHPDDESEFVRWNFDCGIGPDPAACVGQAGQPLHVEAEFSRIVVNNTLTVSRAGTGSGSVTSDPSGIDCGSTCQADFPDTATVALTANAEAGSAFAGWTGECASTDGNICNADMSGDRSVEAVFHLEPVTLEYFARGQGTGSITSDPAGMDCTNDCAAEFAPGTTVTFTAEPAGGSQFGGWGGLCSGETLTCQRTVNADSEVWARFNLAAPPTSRIVSSIVPQSRGGPSGGTLTAFMGVTNAGQEIATECRPALRTEAGINFSFVAIDDDQTGNPIAPDDYPVDVPPNRGDPQEFLVRFTSANAVGPVAARVLVLCSNSTTRFTPSVNTIVLTFEDTPPADIVATISTTTNNGRVEIPDGRNNGVLAGAAINVTGRDFGIPATIRVVPNTANIPLGVTLEICETDASAVCLPDSPLSDTVDVTMGADPVFLKVVLRRVPDVGVPFIPAFIRTVLDFYQVDNEGNVDPATGLRGRTSVGLDISAPDAAGIDGLWSGIARLLDDPDDVPSPVLLAIDGDTAWMMVGDSNEVIATGEQTFPGDGFVLDLETAGGSHVGVGGAFIPRHQILADSFELRQTNLRFAFVDPRMTGPALPIGSLTAARLDLASRALDGNDAMTLNRTGSGSAFSGSYGDCAVTLSDGDWNALRMIHTSLILSGCSNAGSYPVLIVPLMPFAGQNGILIIVSGSGFSGAWGIVE